MAVISKDLGAVTAYAAAVNRGYTGTKEEFETLMASYATVAQQAAESAGNASQSAQSASQSAQNAETAKGTAQQAATDAQTAQASAQESAQSAQQSAQSASQSAQSAESAKDTAVDAVDGFAAGAQQALDSVNQAGINWKSLAQTQALDSEAWAVGTRGGEDVGAQDETYHNNAKYYAEQGGTSAQTATEAAQTATQKASDAQASASAAAESARTLTIDATLTQAGQAADAKATGSILLSTHNHAVSYDYTVFASNYVQGKYYDTNGSEGSSTSYNYYARIPVVAGNTYHFVGGQGARFVVLRSNNAIAQTAENATVFTTQYNGELYVTEFSATPLKMYLYNDYHKISDWTNENINGYTRTTSGTLNIPVSSTAGDVMHLKLNGYNGSYFRNFLLYAVVNGSNVIVASLYSTTGEIVFIAPTATKYTFFINKTQSETGEINFELTNYSKKTVFNTLDKLDVSERFKCNIYGKKIACLGDSFTYGVATYVAKMNSRYLSNAKNYGVASSRIVLDTTSGGTTIQSFLNRYASMDDDAEIITIFGGINDSYDIGAGVLDLGNINSEPDTTTFYGGLKLLVTNLMKKYPNKQIIGIIPPDCQVGQYYINNLPVVQNAEREVYNMYGIPIIDIKRECYKMSTLAEMVSLYRAAVDNIHPSNAGQEALCDTISAGIRRIIP